MIKHTRTAAPRALAREADWASELCDRRIAYYRGLAEYEAGRRKTRPTRVEAVRNRYGSAGIRTALEAVFQKLCGYCDGPLGAQSYKRVDHYRPHSIYPRLAYTWTNLVQACEVCNGYKLDQFPLQDGTQPKANRLNPCALDDSDPNALLDPCTDDPGDHLYWSREVVRGRSDRGRVTVTCVGLDREDLVDDRRFVLKMVEMNVIAYRAAEQAGDAGMLADARTELAAETRPGCRYVGMNRAFLTAAGIDWQTL